MPDIPGMDIPEIENEIEVGACIIWCTGTRTNTTINPISPMQKVYYISQWCNKASVEKEDIETLNNPTSRY